jgi:putative DNA methylase
MASNIRAPKKLIEVALPLDDINVACSYEKMPGIGPHPRGIHLWWARRPLAAARAVLFAQMVNDPGGERGYMAGKSKAQAAAERETLFDIIRDLVKWENTNNEAVLERARAAIRKSWRETCEMNKGKPGFDPDKLPAFHDPFAGGGAIPLEAQRLGLESYASDLNPVAVMINKAMIEIPPKFAGRKPVGPIPVEEARRPDLFKKLWQGIEGLAEDVRRYGTWMRDQAQERIGHLYPKVKITEDMTINRPDLNPYVGHELAVIVWLWARTVKSPNPAFRHVDVPLVSSFVLSSKNGRETYVQPVVDGDNYSFEIRVSKPPEGAANGTKLARGANFACIMSKLPMSGDYIKEEGMANRMGARLMAIVAEGKNGRVYLSPSIEMQKIACSAKPEWIPETPLAPDKRALWTPAYGLDNYGKLFTSRQLVALDTFSGLVQEARTKAIADAKAAGMYDDGIGLAAGGYGATAYGDALAVYLTFAVDRSADFNNSLTGWRQANEKIMYLFARQAIPMCWDFGEANILENVVGGFITNLEYQTKCLLKLYGKGIGFSLQKDAASQNISDRKVVSTDPPYYDNIGYADLSDFFYVWMRRGLKNVFPELFSTLAVPKAEELVATPYRHGSKDKAEQFFLNGMTRAMHNLAEQAHPAFPVTIYYAFKSSDTGEKGTSNTGWETFLEAVIQSGFAITGTWPMRSEQEYRMIGMGSNALASSIVLVCRKREVETTIISRRDFQRELKAVMPEALKDMTGFESVTSPIAPVDLAQAAIGPGMAIFSQYASVLKQDGTPMSVHDAMIMINEEITEYLNPDSGLFDVATLFCNDWFKEYGWAQGQFGIADTLARAKGTSVENIVHAGVLEAESGKVRLLRWPEYPSEYDPSKDTNMPVWESCHHLIRALNQQGESAAGELLSKMMDKTEPIRQLAYYLYTLNERKNNAEEARYYNELITSWHAIVASATEAAPLSEQPILL